MTATMIGLDLAKNVFQAHGVNPDGAVVLRRKMRRGDLETFFRDHPPAQVGIEACGGAHALAVRPQGTPHAAGLREALRQASEE